MRVIWLKISTRESRDLSRGSSLSSSTSFADAATMCSPLTYGGPGSAPSKRYGWLAHLRSCITRFRRRRRPCPLTPATPLIASMSLERMLTYHSRCKGERPTYSLISFFGGRLRSTSAFLRLSMNGRSTLCSLLTTSCCLSFSCSADTSNHESKSLDDENTSVRRKLSSAHSSCRLFCSGVPVISRWYSDEYMRTTCDRSESSFLMRCASSMTMYFHLNLDSAARSLDTSSYVVITMSYCIFDGTRCSAMTAARSAFFSWNLNTRSPGIHRVASFFQLVSVDLGTMMRCGPRMPRSYLRYPSSESVCSV